MLKDEEKELLEYFDEIKSFPVIVEGKKDKAVLKKLGFKKIIILNKKSLYESVCKYEEEKIIILTDFDKKGEELAKKLELFLRKSDRNARNKLRMLFRKNNLNTIEGINKVIKKVMIYGEACSGNCKIYYLRKIRSKRDS
ncbi:MAG TPA: toprim domain-containing protein [Nanoarchaeota archaeon]|nr:toprim domain-containing protein [Nanoarchaeota archaeon]